MSKADWRDQLANVVTTPATPAAVQEVLVENNQLENKEETVMNNAAVVEEVVVIEVGNEVLSLEEVSKDASNVVEVVTQEELAYEKSLGGKKGDFKSLKEIIHSLFKGINKRLTSCSYMCVAVSNSHLKTNKEGIFSISLEKYNIPGVGLKGSNEVVNFYLHEAGRRICGPESKVHIHVLVGDTLYVFFEDTFHPIKLDGLKQVTPEYLLDVANNFINRPKPNPQDPLDDII